MSRISHCTVYGSLLMCGFACGGDTTGPRLPTYGVLRVAASATGADAPATYSIFVNGMAGAVTTMGLETNISLGPGAYTVRIAVARNCEVVGENPRTATVGIGQTTVLSFSVRCAAVYGDVRVKTVTTGVDVDPNGYAVRMEGLTLEGKSYPEFAVGSADEVTIRRVAGGNQPVTLVGLALNCNTVGANRRPLLVTPGLTTMITFEVACIAATAQFAYVAGSGATQDIRIINADRSGDRAVTADQFRDADPAWSPDGARLAFTTERDGNREIYVIGADGSNAVRLTNNPSEDSHPAWSPDGTRIAFVSTRQGGPDIFVMNTDGTNVVRLTSDDATDTDPAWSPDGRRIAFTREQGLLTQVYVMDATGAAITKITTDGGRQPAWSPDGTRLAYVTLFCGGF